MAMSVAPAIDTDELFASALHAIRRRFGEGAIMKLGESPYRHVAVIPTGSLALDIALGVGGIPRGRVTEIYGPESSGKTTLCQHIVAAAQRRGGRAVFIDMEHALDQDYAARCGVDVDDLFISQPDTGEQALEIVEAMVRGGAVVVVVDSVAALVPRAEIEGEMGENHAGLQARLMSQALRKLSGAVRQSNTALLFTNQLRQKIGVMFGNPETTTGGMALRFYASVRLDLRRVQAIKENGEVIGNRIKVTVKKNKVAPPFRTAEFDVLFNAGICPTGDVLDTASNWQVVDRIGRSYFYGGVSLGQGRDDAIRRLRDTPELVLEIERRVRQAAGIDNADPGLRVDLVVCAESNGKQCQVGLGANSTP
jgi:recombination protein RecA